MSTHQKKILVVEDDWVNASFIAEVLEERGYSVLTAGDGEIGLSILAREENIAAVVTDIFMPNREGIAFIRAVKSRYGAVKIAAMTGAINYESIFSTARDFGAELTIRKPFDIDKFADRIDELLRS